MKNVIRPFHDKVGYENTISDISTLLESIQNSL